MTDIARQGNAAHEPTPAWMRLCLRLAGVYNIAWGSVMVLAPIWSLRALGVDEPSTRIWPAMWACIGMIIGVYGVGYLIASTSPARHWPIVLVGLLGKVFGPIGFVFTAAKGDLPWSMGVTIFTNDLAWWVPFAMILWHAARASQPLPPSEPVSLHGALCSLTDGSSRTLMQLTQQKPALVVLLRHSGCTFCKETLSELARVRSSITNAGCTLVVVGMSPDVVSLRNTAAQRGLTDAVFVADPDRLLYRALELRRGTFGQLFGPTVFVRGLLAFLRGHGVGKLEGDGFQMPGTFVISRGEVIKAFRHTTAADRPDYGALACPIN